MNVEREQGSLIPYKEDEAVNEVEDEAVSQEQCNLTITRNYKNKTRRVEMSKILQDSELTGNRSLSPVAPLATGGDGRSDSEAEQEATSGAEFELTIKSKNSVIRIQGFDTNSTISFNAEKGDTVYEMLSKEVDKIFRRPERAEIEKAVKTVSEIRLGEKNGKCEWKPKPVSRQKKTWKMLTKSVMNMKGFRSMREQRRGSVERYPKMVLLQPEAKKVKEEDNYPKMVMIDGKRLEAEKSKLRNQSLEIEKSKKVLRKEKKNLTEGQKILKEKREAVEGKRANLADATSADEQFIKMEMDIMAEEKLCMELEKKLLGEEKIMLQEEMDLLKKEKEMLEKERSLLGQEINVLEEEKNRKRVNDQQQVCDDIDDVLRETLKLSSQGKQRRENVPKDSGDLTHPSVPPWFGPSPGHDPYHCPSVYIPVYNRPMPYYQCEYCRGGGRVEHQGYQKDITTQTTESPLSEVQPTAPALDAAKDMDLPFGLLSSFFPRIVVMKSFQEEVSGDENDVKIVDLSKAGEETENEKEDEKGCEEPKFLQGIHDEVEDMVEADRSVGEDQDASEKASVCSAAEDRPVSPVEEHPLTKIGYKICDELSALSEERKRGVNQAGEEEEKEKAEVEVKAEGSLTGNKGNETSCNVTFELRSGVVSLAMHDDNLNIQMRSPRRQEPTDQSQKHNASDKILVKKSQLWHPNGGDSYEGPEVDLSLPDKRNVFITVSINEHGPIKEANQARCSADGFHLAGGDRTHEGLDLSPRTGTILKSLKEKLEVVEGSDKLRNEFKFPGLFFIRPFDSSRPGEKARSNNDKARRKPIRPEAPVQEYYCEECLATMRLFEDRATSVKNIIDKFETIIHLGSY